MVFSINAKFSGDKTMAQFKNLAVTQNGTKEVAAIQKVDAAAAAAPSTVTVLAAAGTGAAGAAATGTATGAAGALASVVAGSGTDGNGQVCTCQCLCGMNAFPANAAVSNFGGFPGQIA
jgi:hypothetical protein